MALMPDMTVNVSFERRHVHGDAVPTGVSLRGGEEEEDAPLRHGWVNRSKWHHIILIMAVRTQMVLVRIPQLS